jgi:hypothetical protein
MAWATACLPSGAWRIRQLDQDEEVNWIRPFPEKGTAQPKKASQIKLNLRISEADTRRRRPCRLYCQCKLVAAGAERAPTTMSNSLVAHVLIVKLIFELL